MSDLFATAFAGLPVPAAIVTADQRLTAANQSLADIMGRSPDSLAGLTVEALLAALPAPLAVSRRDLPDGGAVLVFRPAAPLEGWPHQAILEAIKGGVTVRAEDGRIIASNAAARALMGHGTTPDYVDRDGGTLPQSRHPAFVALRTDAPADAVIGARLPDAGVRWLQVHSVPARHPQAGRVVVSSFTEIGDLLETQRRLDESQLRFRAIFDQTFEFIGLLETDGTLIEANRTALAFIGMALDQVAGRHFADTPWWSHSPADQATLRDGIAEAAAGRFVRFETTHPGVDGSISTVDFSLKPVVDESGQVLFIIPEGRDITHLKRAEQELREATRLAEAANRAKSAFLATMSHELRTPLNAVIGFSETIMEQVFGPLGNSRYAEYVGLIHSAGSHLRDVIEDILDVARIEIGELALQEDVLDLRPCLEGAVAMIRPKADECHITLACDLPADLPRLRADPLRLRQIALNLLSNAVKFTPSGGRVRLSVRADDDGMAISVSDTGIGIRPEDMDSIWTPFFQADASLARRFGGTGLGLPIVRHYVQAHGGTIVVDSTPGQGTTFTVRLPAARLVRVANDRGHGEQVELKG